VSLRQKLLMMFSFTVIVCVATVGWTVSTRVRKVFDQLYQQQTAQLVNQFQLEFDLRAKGVADTLSSLAGSERMLHISQEVALTGESAAFVTDAASFASENHLDYLEIVGADGNIISSSQWPARFGYHEPAVDGSTIHPFLKLEELPDGSASVGLFAVRKVGSSDAGVTLVGGRMLNQDSVSELPVPPGTSVFFYGNGEGFNPTSLSVQTDSAANRSAFYSVIQGVRESGQPASSIIYITRQRADSVNAAAIPLKSEKGNVLAVVVIATARRSMVEVQNHIRSIAFGVASGGILFAIAASLWIASRISSPIEELAAVAEQVADGEWQVHVKIDRRWLGKDEISVLQESFNHMTGQLMEQRDKLVQTERVAAWRELARRLAHELKNPLFPLQLTVENLIRARQLDEQGFDEVFRESTRTLGMEIANLKAIIGRFSDFSRMPKPQVERLDACEVMQRAYALYSLASPTVGSRIEFHLDIPTNPIFISADADLLHRAISNLVLNAMDSMADMGRDGALTLSVSKFGDKVRMRVADSGKGMSAEERDRIFTPYYTTKEFGTGLGLAIVQSVVADHHGTIAVESSEGGGSTFLIELPAASDGEGAA